MIRPEQFRNLLTRLRLLESRPAAAPGSGDAATTGTLGVSGRHPDLPVTQFRGVEIHADLIWKEPPWFGLAVPWRRLSEIACRSLRRLKVH